MGAVFKEHEHQSDCEKSPEDPDEASVWTRDLLVRGGVAVFALHFGSPFRCRRSVLELGAC
jgi:hypothetical protein